MTATLASFLPVTLTSAGLIVVLMSGVAVAARRTGRAAVVDVAWGPGFVLIALACAAIGNQPLSWVLAALVTIWGVRLASHIGWRSRGQGEDPRYTALLSGGGGLLRKVLLPQGLALWFISLPLQGAAAAEHPDLDAMVLIGAGLWAVGLALESIGDAQLAAYKRDPDRGPVLDRGLWGWTRHPNYFGDALVWWGVWLAAAGAWPVVLTVLSPIAMTYFIRNVTGAKLLERTMMQRPAYREYAERVPMFVPRPPK